MAITLTRREAETLLNAVEDQYEKLLEAVDRLPPANLNERYGFGTENLQFSVIHYIENNQDVQRLLQEHATSGNGTTLNGKDLYNRKQKLEEESPPEMMFRRPYDKVYFAFIGCKDLGEFKKKYQSALAIQQHRYTGYYYSFRDDCIKELKMELTFDGLEVTGAQYGFHDNSDIHDPFIGEGAIDDQIVDVTFTHPERGSMHLMIHLNGKDPLKAPFLTSMLMTKSSSGYPIATEVFLVRPDADYYSDHLILIKRYLSLKRNQMRVFDREYEALEDLRVRGVLSNTISHMAGNTYRLWSYTRRGAIVQTKFSIYNDYSAKLYSSIHLENEKKQTCLLSLSDTINQRLIVSAHPERGVGYISIAILEIPGEEDELFAGVFSTVGLRRHPFTADYVAILKDNTAFQPEKILPDQIDGYLQNNPRLNLLKNHLDNLPRKRNPVNG